MYAFMHMCVCFVYVRVSVLLYLCVCVSVYVEYLCICLSVGRCMPLCLCFYRCISTLLYLYAMCRVCISVSIFVSTRYCMPVFYVSVQKRYSGLAALNSDTLVASGGSDPPCVDIINLGGEVLRSFSHDVTTGAELFAYPGYLCMMPDRRHFLVSDRRKAALFCLDTSGLSLIHI